MATAKRIKPLDVFTADQWREVQARSDWLGLGMVLHVWAVIFGMIALAVWQPWFIPIAIPVIGARQLGLAVLMHEAAHGGLHRAATINDFVGHWLVGAPVGANLAAYRTYHLKHHKYAQQPEDPDLPLSAPFPITPSSFRRKVIRDLTGQTFFKQRSNQILNALGVGIRKQKGAENRFASAREAVIPFAIANAILLAGLTLAGAWWAYFVLWLLPMATWNQLVTRLRNIAEHAVTPDHDDPLRHARTTRANLLERIFIAPYWVNYHCEHHMFMHVPCYRLAKAHRLLEANGVTDLMEVQTGYATVLRQATTKPEAASA